MMKTQFKNSILLALLFFMVVILVSGCNNGDSDPTPADSDKETDTSTDGDNETPICEAGAMRCHPSNPQIVQKCSNDGLEWIQAEECDLDETCEEGTCQSSEDGDLDEAPIDGDSQDGDEPDGDTEDGDSEDGDITDGDEDDVEIDPDVEEFEDPPSLENCWHHPEMVPVADRFCMDKWEAVVMENPDCTGTAYGQNVNDYPEGFPACVECVVDDICPGVSCQETGGPQQTPLYACSKEGVIPSTYVSWYQARKSCLNAGKAPCGQLDWIEACEGPNENVFPYGNEFIPGMCQDDGWKKSYPAFKEDEILSRLTGSKPGCISEYGVFDMAGNVDEWVQFGEASHAEVRYGGTIFATSVSHDDHQCAPPVPPATDARAQLILTGFRCCLYLESDGGRDVF